MKIKILLALTLFIGYYSNAQMQFEAIAGINLGQVSTKVNGEKQDGLKPGVGYLVGAHVEFTLSKSFFFQAGLEFESIHRKIKFTTTTGSLASDPLEIATYNDKLSLNYLNIPLKIYLKNPTKENGLRVGLGPFFGFGLGGKYKNNDTYQATYNGTTTYQAYNNVGTVKFGSKSNSFKMINIGLGLNLGYVFNPGISVGIYSDMGLVNISHSNRSKTTTYATGLTVGYMFKGKNKTKSK